MHGPKAPTPGSTTAAASSIDRGIGGQAGIGTDVLERLLRRSQVADAVVEHGDSVTTCSGSQRALGGRDPGALDARPRRAASGPPP